MTGSQDLPRAVKQELLSQPAVKSKRDRGNKHFNKVAYMGPKHVDVPRWAADDAKLIEVIQFQ